MRGREARERALLPTDPDEEPEMRMGCIKEAYDALFCVPFSRIDSRLFNFLLTNRLSRCCIVYLKKKKHMYSRICKLRRKIEIFRSNRYLRCFLSYLCIGRVDKKKLTIYEIYISACLSVFLLIVKKYLKNRLWFIY